LACGWRHKKAAGEAAAVRFVDQATRAIFVADPGNARSRRRQHSVGVDSGREAWFRT